MLNKNRSKGNNSQFHNHSESEKCSVCLTLFKPLDYSLWSSSVHRNLKARIMEWVAMSSSRGSSQPRDGTWVSCIAGRFFTIWVTTEAPQSQFSSVQFICSVVSDSLRPHESQHTRPPCPSPTPGVHPDSHPSSHWCHPAISSSVVLFSSCPQSFQHQSLFQWVNSLHELAKVLEFQL